MRAKLEQQPIEDLRVDLKDGQGIQPDDVEDHAASAAGHALAQFAAEPERNPFLAGVRI